MTRTFFRNAALTLAAVLLAAVNAPADTTIRVTTPNGTYTQTTTGSIRVQVTAAAAKAPAAAVKATAAVPRTVAFQAERAWLDGAEARNEFPVLKGHYDVLGAAMPTYNCIAHSLGYHDRWVNPATGPAANPLAEMDKMYYAQGYQRLSTLDYRHVAGRQKVVVYATKDAAGRIFEVTHAAIEYGDGTWTSKLGKAALIRHDSPDALDGPLYGVPVAVYVR